MAHRVKQFACAFTTKIRPQERAEVESLLSPKELALFNGMGLPAMRHSLRVFRKLQRQCSDDTQLLAAALLHDVGKGHVTMAHRVAVVLLEAAWPDMLKRMGSSDAPGWRRGFYEHWRHAELGAELVRQAGSHQRVVELIRYHHAGGTQGPPGQAVLRIADEGS